MMRMSYISTASHLQYSASEVITDKWHNAATIELGSANSLVDQLPVQSNCIEII